MGLVAVKPEDDKPQTFPEAVNQGLLSWCGLLACLSGEEDRVPSYHPQRGDTAPKEAPGMQLETWHSSLSFHLHIKKIISSSACADSPGVLSMLEWHKTLPVCAGRKLFGVVFKCSSLHRLNMEGSLGVLF